MRKSLWVPDKDSADRAHRSRSEGRADLFTGLDALSGNVAAYTGTVMGVEDSGERAAVGKRWRISIEIPD